MEIGDGPAKRKFFLGQMEPGSRSKRCANYTPAPPCITPPPPYHILHGHLTLLALRYATQCTRSIQTKFRATLMMGMMTQQTSWTSVWWEAWAVYWRCTKYALHPPPSANTRL